MATARDYLLAAIVGLLAAAFGLSILVAIDFSFPYHLAAFFLGFPLLGVVGVALGGYLGRRVRPILFEFTKFGIVGALSAAIDFAILNAVSRLTGITAGLVVGWVNAPGFLLAVLSGYVWNKRWTFHAPHLPLGGRAFLAHLGELFSDFHRFLFVTLVGLVLNSAIVVALTTLIPPPGSISPLLWLNAAKVIASLVAMFWNFAGYRLIAFRQKKPLGSSH